MFSITDLRKKKTVNRMRYLWLRFKKGSFLSLYTLL